MTQKNNISNEHEQNLTDIAPLLSSVKKENPFIVPENYFEELPAIVQAKCIEHEKPSPSIIDLLLGYLLKPQYAFAMITVVLLIVAGIYLYKPVHKCMEDLETQLANLSTNQTLLYIDEYIDDYDEYLLAEAYLESTANESTSQEDPDQLEEYIINHIDETLIMEELL